MTNQDALYTLIKYQNYRTGVDERTLSEIGLEPKEITEAIYRAIAVLDESCIAQ